MPVPPARILDTRTNLGANGPVAANQTITLTVDGAGNIAPTNVAAVVLNITVTQPTAAGDLTAWPDGTTKPATSNLNYTKAETIPNLAIVPVGLDGKIDIQNQSAGTAQIIADTSGYFTTGTPAGGSLQPVPPARILDTRTNLGANGPVPPTRPSP